MVWGSDGVGEGLCGGNWDLGRGSFENKEEDLALDPEAGFEKAASPSSSSASRRGFAARGVRSGGGRDWKREEDLGFGRAEKREEVVEDGGGGSSAKLFSELALGAPKAVRPDAGGCSSSSSSSSEEA